MFDIDWHHAAPVQLMCLTLVYFLLSHAGIAEEFINSLLLNSAGSEYIAFALIIRNQSGER